MLLRVGGCIVGQMVAGRSEPPNNLPANLKTFAEFTIPILSKNVNVPYKYLLNQSNGMKWNICVPRAK